MADSTSLLTTKLYAAAARARRVPRPRLLAGLQQDRPVTLLVAPAGYGKTTLLSEWRLGRSQPTAWLSLDEGDNDPAQFWAYWVAALQTQRAGLGAAALALLQPPQPAPWPAMLTALLNEIAACPEQLTLVLDDYHVITTPSIHAALTFLLDHRPASLRLVVAARADPPWPLARLRARHELAELRAEALRFTDEEAAVFLQDVMALPVAPADVQALAALTEGWPAGLQLAALTLQGRPDVAGLVAAFTGSHRYILDYLTEEVLSRQPAEVQAFLQRTCIVDRLCAPLCQALWPAEAAPSLADCQARLEGLERANLFLVALDGDRRWYRFHHLFAQALRHRLDQAQPGLAASLHQHASAWFEAHDLLDEAIHHAAAGEAWDTAARLLITAGFGELLAGRAATVSRRLAQLPAPVWQAHPPLYLLQAAARIAQAQYGAVEAGLRELDAVLADRPAEAAELRPVRRALLAIAWSFLLDPRALPLVQAALTELPPTDPVYGLLQVSLGAAYLAAGELPAARAVVEQALAVIPAGPASLMLRLGLTTSLMLVLLAQGQLRAAAALGQRLADELPVPPPPLPGAAYLVAQLGAAAYLRDDLSEAERLGQQGRQLAQATQDEAAEIYALANLAFTYQALDAPASAQECLAAARAVARRFQSAAPMGAMVAGLEALLALRRGDRAAALAWAQANPLPEPPARLTPYDWHHLAGAWVLLARADWAAARQRLEQLRQAAEAGGNGAFVLLGWIGLALAEAGAGDRQAARAACEQALRLAEPEDCRRVFLDEGEPLRQVLADWLTTAGRRPEAARLAAFAAQLTAAQPPPALEALPEPLSPREREVLGLIADGLTNAEIAERLIVGLSTVKKHINAIFGKLGVTHRAQAIARARALKLV